MAAAVYFSLSHKWFLFLLYLHISNSKCFRRNRKLSDCAFIGHSYFTYAHHNLIYDLTPLKWRNRKCIFDMWFCGSLKITKTLQKKLRIFLMFKANMSLLTSKYETVLKVSFRWYFIERWKPFKKLLSIRQLGKRKVTFSKNYTEKKYWI